MHWNNRKNEQICKASWSVALMKIGSVSEQLLLPGLSPNMSEKIKGRTRKHNESLMPKYCRYFTPEKINVTLKDLKDVHENNTEV